MPGLSFRAAPVLPAPWGWAGCAQAAAAFSLHGHLQTRAGGNSPGSCSQAPNVSFLNPLPVPGRSAGHLPWHFCRVSAPERCMGTVAEGSTVLSSPSGSQLSCGVLTPALAPAEGFQGGTACLEGLVEVSCSKAMCPSWKFMEIWPHPVECGFLALASAQGRVCSSS